MRKNQGSLLVDLMVFCVLLLFFIIPAIIYAVWRQTKTEMVCRVCGATNLVPSDSPAAQRYATTVEVPPVCAQSTQH